MSHVAKVEPITSTQRIHQVWKRRSREIIAAIVGSIVLFGVALFVALAARVDRGATMWWDEAILRALRRPDNPALTIGPHWLFEAAMDATSLGSPMVLTFFILASIGFLYFEGQKRVALMTTISAGGGAVLAFILKQIFLRPRPTAVPHLRDVFSPSFPSGHTMGAAVVYLTIGVMFMKSFKSRRAKAYVLAWATFLTFIVGASRVFLGVHYPTDVLGGWIAGVGWALGCYAIAKFVPNHPLPEVDDQPRPRADI